MVRTTRFRSALTTTMREAPSWSMKTRPPPSHATPSKSEPLGVHMAAVIAAVRFANQGDVDLTAVDHRSSEQIPLVVDGEISVLRRPRRPLGARPTPTPRATEAAMSQDASTWQAASTSWIHSVQWPRGRHRRSRRRRGHRRSESEPVGDQRNDQTSGSDRNGGQLVGVLAYVVRRRVFVVGDHDLAARPRPRAQADHRCGHRTAGDSTARVKRLQSASCDAALVQAGLQARSFRSASSLTSRRRQGAVSPAHQRC